VPNLGLWKKKDSLYLAFEDGALEITKFTKV